MLHSDTFLSVGGDCTAQHIGFSAGQKDVRSVSPVLRVLEAGEMLVFSLVGEADLDYAQALRSRLKAAVCDQIRKTVIVDLSACDYMDSSVLNALLSVGRFAQEMQCRFILSRPGRNLKRTFDLMRMGQYLTIVDSMDMVTPC